MMGLRALVLSLLLLISLPLSAGQPWYGTPTGVPYRWNNGQISWGYMNQALSDGYDAATVAKWVQEAFDKWSNAVIPLSGATVAATQLKATALGALSASDLGPLTQTPPDCKTSPKACEDYCVAVKKFLENDLGTASRGTFIFDKDGRILSCMGLDGVLGYTVIRDFNEDDDVYTIDYGFTILNGPIFKKSLQGAVKATAENSMKAAILHEVGHMLGLDHSGLNDPWAIKKTVDANNKITTIAPISTTTIQYVPTMYPYNVTTEQMTLHKDDAVAAASLYPSDGFKTQFCTVTGRILDKASHGVQGVEVGYFTTTADDVHMDATTTMTGANYPIPSNVGNYYLRGLVPNKTYQIYFGPVPQFGSAGSNIGNFTDVESPQLSCALNNDAKDDAFEKCLVTAAAGATKTVSCTEGGKLLVMDNAQIDNVVVDAKYANAPTPVINDPQPKNQTPNPIPPDTNAASGGKSGGCSLIR